MSFSEKIKSSLHWALLVFGVAVLALSAVVLYQQIKKLPIFGSQYESNVQYSVFPSPGSSTTSTEVTNAYIGTSSTIRTKGYENMHLDVTWTSVSSVIYSSILVEISNDEGTTFYPYSQFLTTSTVQHSLYASNATGDRLGIPFIFPGTQITSTTVFNKGFVDLPIVADLVRISVKKSNGLAIGTSTIAVRATLTSP